MAAKYRDEEMSVESRGIADLFTYGVWLLINKTKRRRN